MVITDLLVLHKGLNKIAFHGSSQSNYQVTLSIIIISRNTCELLDRCLKSIYAVQREFPSGEIETFVVDNASSDGSVEMVQKQFPWVRLEYNPLNIGFVRANNQVLANLDSKFVLLLNSDAALTGDALQNLISCLERHPDAGAVGPMLINPDGSFQASHGNFPTVLSSLVNLFGLSKLIYGPYYPSAGPEEADESIVDWMGGACMLVRGAVVKKVGILDDNIVMYAEEMDWCFRMHQANWPVYYCPEAQVIHIGGGSSASSRPWLMARKWESTIYFMAKHHGKVKAHFLRFSVFIVALFRTLLFGLLALIQPASTKKWRAKARENFNLARLESNYGE